MPVNGDVRIYNVTTNNRIEFTRVTDFAIGPHMITVMYSNPEAPAQQIEKTIMFVVTHEVIIERHF